MVSLSAGNASASSFAKGMLIAGSSTAPAVPRRKKTIVAFPEGVSAIAAALLSNSHVYLKIRCKVFGKGCIRKVCCFLIVFSKCHAMRDRASVRLPNAQKSNSKKRGISLQILLHEKEYTLLPHKRRLFIQ